MHAFKRRLAVYETKSPNGKWKTLGATSTQTHPNQPPTPTNYWAKPWVPRQTCLGCGADIIYQLTKQIKTMPRCPKTKTMANTWSYIVLAVWQRSKYRSEKWFEMDYKLLSSSASASSGSIISSSQGRNLFTQNFRWLNAKTVAETEDRNGYTLGENNRKCNRILMIFRYLLTYTAYWSSLNSISKISSLQILLIQAFKKEHLTGVITLWN